MLYFFSRFGDNVVSHFGRFFWLIQGFGILLIIMGITYIIFYIWITFGDKIKTRADVGEDEEDD